MRWLLLSVLSWLVAFVVMFLFEGASGPDFEPVQSGKFFEAYHTMLGIILAIVVWPAALPELLRAKFSITLNDSVVLIFISLVDGLVFAGFWHLFARLHSRSRRTDATPTI